MAQGKPPLQEAIYNRRRVLVTERSEQGVPNLLGETAGAEEMIGSLDFLVTQTAVCIRS